MTEQLKGRFATLWQAVTRDDRLKAHAVGVALLDRYEHPSRHYHNLDHVSHCLNQAKLVHDRLPDVDALNLAIWFHDAVCDPGASDNEVKSAALFRDMAEQTMSSVLVTDVERLILATATDRVPRQEDEAFMVDIDHTSFGLPWELFLADSLAVRAESRHLTDEQYAVQQARFLTSLLRRDALFATDFFRARYETIARSNIVRYLDRIRSQ